MTSDLVGSKVILSGNGDVAYSRVVTMSGKDACGIACLMQELTGTSPMVTVTAQVSLDQVNWSTPSIGPAGSQDVGEVGAVPLEPLTNIIAPYLRLKFTLSGDFAILGVDLTRYKS